MLKETETEETIRFCRIFVFSGISIVRGGSPLPPHLATPTHVRTSKHKSTTKTYEKVATYSIVNYLSTSEEAVNELCGLQVKQPPVA